MNATFDFPSEVSFIIKSLEDYGFDTHLVGGCVRDILSGRTAHDYDITTNARPNQIIEAFKNFNVIPTGIKHGTVTVLIGNFSAEITTFRTDGSYSDSRHPDSVRFSDSIYDDLSRRDFTINSIAMPLNGNIIDPFCGLDDIKNKILRCTGNPQKRFSEDALRILRCIRFSSELGFSVEPQTSDALVQQSELLQSVSAERIHSELDRLICGENCFDVLMKYYCIIAQFIPEISPCIGFDQHSPYHKYNVWEHTVRAVNAAPHDKIIRLALLLHDIAKPVTFKADSNGRGHFKGHAEKGSLMAHDILKRLKYDNSTISNITSLIFYHSSKIHSDYDIKHMLSLLGQKQFFRLMDVMHSDNCAKQDFVLSEAAEILQLSERADKLIENNCCICLSQLDINGSDILSLGAKPTSVGKILHQLLDLVMSDCLENQKQSLSDKAQQIIYEI